MSEALNFHTLSQNYTGLVNCDFLTDLLFTNQSSNAEILIISAFFSDDVVTKFLSYKTNTRSKFIFRLKPKDFIDKTASFKSLDLLIEKKIDVFFNPKLHSKIYLFNNRRLISGSANFTKKGLGLIHNANIENLFSSLVSNNDLEFIDSIFKESSQLNQSKLEKMKEFIKDYNTDKKEIPDFWPRALNDNIDGLLITDFPNFNNSKVDLKKNKAYQWLYRSLENTKNKERFFGELTSLLHDKLVEDPKPYRSSIKELLDDFLKYLKVHKDSNITFDEPNYSKRIFINLKGD